MAYLTAAGFASAVPKARPFQSWLAYGPPKRRKTQFGLSFPRPIALFNFDRSVDDILNEFPELAEDLEVCDFHNDTRDFDYIDQAHAKDIEDRVAKSLSAAYNHPAIRTVMFDKESTLWEIARLAEFGRLSGVKARNYEAVNLRMRKYFESHKWAEKNLILISDSKDEWKDDKPTGRQIHDGFKQTLGIVQFGAVLDKDDEGFYLKIQEAGVAQTRMLGKVYRGDEAKFPIIAMAAMPRVPVEAWGI